MNALRLKNKKFPWPVLLILITGFHFLASFQVLLQAPFNLLLTLTLLGYPAVMWAFVVTLRAITKQHRCEPELLACWLSSIGLVISASFSAEFAWVQGASIVGGMVVYAVLRWVIADPERAMKIRPYVAIIAVGLLGVTVLLAPEINNVRRWINIGGFSIQPSELAKVAFIFAGAATLDRLQRSQSIWRYFAFSLGCVGALFLMSDFGTALIFFLVFLLLVFLRSGDVRSIALVCAAAVLGAILIIYFRPLVAGRFAVYRQVWDYMHEGGFQQTRVLIYSASGGLFGLGLGNGLLRNIFAADNDLIFGVVAEEMGLLLAFLIPFSYIAMAVYAVRAAAHARSAFYSIAAVSAAGLLIIQAALNIFGITDLLPLTGVTLPFVSRGGTSMLASWGLIGFIAALRANERRTRN